MLLVVSSTSERISPDFETQVDNAQHMHLGVCWDIFCKLEITSLVTPHSHSRELPKNWLALRYRLTLEYLE